MLLVEIAVDHTRMKRIRPSTCKVERFFETQLSNLYQG